MHIVLGATGHVGSAVANTLLERGEPVTVIVRDAKKARPLQERGAQLAIADVRDVESLRTAFHKGERLFLLNPPGSPAGDLDQEERSTIRSLVSALEGSGLQKIVALSTYGAQPGTRIGDLGSLHELEVALASQPVPSTVLRAAYYMTNWDLQLEAVKSEGKLVSFFPADFSLPMVAPRDIGHAAANLLLEPVTSTGVHHIEGPARYTPSQVADAFASVLHKAVQLEQIPRDRWTQALKGMGFSDVAAESFAGMIALAQQAHIPEAAATTHGATSLQRYVERLVQS